MPQPIPAIDQSACAGWNENDISLYNSLTYYFAQMQVDRRKTYSIYSKFMGKRKWTPNMSSTMRAIRREPSPHIRQFAFPNAIASIPKVDITDVREMTVDCGVFKHRFESQVMYFAPSFSAFFNDQVEVEREDLMEKAERFEDIYYRGNMYYLSPNIWVAGSANELTAAPRILGNQAGTAAGSKTTAWAQAILPTIADNLSLLTVNRAMVTAEVDLRVPSFTGEKVPADGEGMTDKFCLVCSSEAFNQFTFDPYLQQNKNCALDVVNQSFKGNLFGRVTCRLEDMPIRIAADGTIPTPEVRELDPAAYNYNESIVNPIYQQAPYEVAFLMGAEGYDMINVGPPPSAFANNGMPNGFGKMFWNGEFNLTKNFLIQCLADDQATTIYQANTYGEHIKIVSQSTYGVLPKQRRNVIPILFKRKRGAGANSLFVNAG